MIGDTHGSITSIPIAVSYIYHGHGHYGDAKGGQSPSGRAGTGKNGRI